MIRLLFLCAAVLACHVFVVACGGAEEQSALKELERARSGNVDVVLLTPDEGLRTGDDTFFVEFRSASDGRLVDVGNVQATATMPMAGMAPMSGSVNVTPTKTSGRYSVASDLSMAGDWRIQIEWSGPEGRGSVSLSTSAQ